ncbi:MAG: ATP-binding cassette domain-containing protein, partial [Lachnospiraceae bacterium]|nr:ATP-binding cassette domain-containing protein [Lachnospiraceae bacterium]
MERIKVKYFTDKIEKLRYIDGKSDWIDLRAAEEICLKKGEILTLIGPNGAGKTTILKSIIRQL